MHILHVVGARPNFMKAAPVLCALGKLDGMKQVLVHTGQHYDFNMSDVFFSQLGIPEPAVNLGVGSGTYARQTGEIMRGLEGIMLKNRPDLALVYGDVNSTVAAALVCSKLGIRVGHVEAGLRSFDRTMPEEINRLVTDQLSDLLFTPSEDADLNLKREGIAPDTIHRVGNVMIDSLIALLPSAERLTKNGYPDEYALVTLHRPANVDNSPTLKSILDSLLEINKSLDVIFPVHPRTRQWISKLKYQTGNLQLLDPLPYIEFLALQRRARVVITDSGGIQEETTYLGVPCLTLRKNTERPVTVNLGTNTVVGNDPEKIRYELSKILDGCPKKGTIPPLWDGQTGQRIASILQSLEQ